MIFDLKILEIELLKKFNGINNYFNPSHFNGRTIYRRESKFEGKLLVSDIVDDLDSVLLQHTVDDSYLWSYEDARFINENEISVCCCKRDKNDIEKIINVEYKKYNLTTKEFTNFKTQNAHFEKHWQFYGNKIIYHVNPYTIMDDNENIIYKKEINLQPWIEKYGNPGLSTNVFEVDDIKYLLFHSYVWFSRLHFKYFVGLLRLNYDLSPLGYTYKPLFEANREYNDVTLLNDLWSWRKTKLCEVVKYEVIFPMNVVVDDKNLNIYSGLNDCSAVNIKIDKQLFVDKIKNEPFILL
jgi:hypothetical protein